MKRSKIITYIVLAITAVLIGVAIGKLFDSNDSSENTQTQEDYPLLADRLFVDNPNDIKINFSKLRSTLNNYFKENNISGSMYFEFLPTGSSVRVNGDSRYRAASLIKLPVAMELFKAAEQGKINLDDKVTLKEEWLNERFGELYEKGVGYELSYNDAVKILLQDSDNTALRLIIEATDSTLEIEDRALGALDIEFNLDSEDGILVGTRSYSSFLKCLYFACYNTKEDSQRILEYLSETNFDNRIVAGIEDKSLTVAHKIGVFNTQVQSDCGIVYLDRNNYIICIMIEGSNNDSTNGHFSNLSNAVYSYLKYQ
jgi:beta-lactamase class A